MLSNRIEIQMEIEIGIENGRGTILNNKINEGVVAGDPFKALFPVKEPDFC